MSNPTLATISLGCCEGCHLSLLDAHEGLLELLGGVDLVHSPLTCGDAFPSHVDVVMVEGAVTTDEDRRRLLEAREAATTLVAVGSCATLGGIGGLRNLHTVDDVKRRAFGEANGKGAGLASLEPTVSAAVDVVHADIEVPGCAPLTGQIVAALVAAVSGDDYEMPRRNLCAECSRTKKILLDHSAEFVSETVYALMELENIDPDTCFLEQGVVCMGAMTREGCGARCTSANIPCRGCSGPSRRDFEQGGKAVDALAAVIPAGALMFMDDLIGTGYRYSMPISVFPAIVDEEGRSDD